MKTAGQDVSAPNAPADQAVKGILLRLAEAIERNWRGIIDDHNPEPLHDLRVATRRTRTALGELKGALPKKTVAPFRRDFKWLASITGPCRDYDVWLNDLNSDLCRVAPPESTSSEFVRNAAHEQRQEAWFNLKEQLLLPRFQGLVPAWKIVLSEKAPEKSKYGGRPALGFATERIKRAHTRLVRRRPEIEGGASEAILHKTRIDAKKLRYLLEFFSGFYSTAAVQSVIVGLKILQDDLGRLNDCVIQRQLLARLRSRLEKAGASSSSTVMTVIVDLEEHIRARQTRCRAPFLDHFSAFTNDVANQKMANLIKRPLSAATDDPATP